MSRHAKCPRLKNTCLIKVRIVSYRLEYCPGKCEDYFSQFKDGALY